jgi:hypothetical protein
VKRYLVLAITACVGIAVTGCGPNSVKSPPTTGGMTQEEVVTHRKYYNREKDECTMPDGGVLLNYSKWMNANGGGFGGDAADDCGLYRDSKKSAVDYAKEYPQGLVAPGRYDMLVRRKLMDKEEAAEATASQKRLEDWAVRSSEAEQKQQEKCQDQLEKRGYGDPGCY